MLPEKERGAPSTPMLSETGKTIFIEIPHFPAQDLITPKDLQDILVVTVRTKRHIMVLCSETRSSNAGGGFSRVAVKTVLSLEHGY